MKIIDDDVDVLISQEIEDDITAKNEDAPQIVAVIDERPPSLQIDEKTNSNLWKPIGQPSITKIDTHALKLNSFQLNKQVRDTDVHKPDLRVTKQSIKYDKKVKPILTNMESDISEEKSNLPLRKKDNYNMSPIRRNIYSDSRSEKHNEEDTSPLRRKHMEENYSSLIKEKNYDYSPPRKSFEEYHSTDYIDYSPPRRRNKERSPPLKQTKDDTSPNKKEDNNSPPIRKKTHDNSPPRRKNRDVDSPTRRNWENDNSPPRRKRNEDISPPRRKNNDDSSPPRRRNKKDDSSPLRRRTKESNSSSPKRRDEDDDCSPLRKRTKEYHSSPPRKHKSDNSPPEQRKYEESNLSLKKKDKDDRKIKKSRWSPEKSPESSSTEKFKKTLDGKRAGLQNAEDLFKESMYLRQKEDEIFKKMSAEVSGRNAVTVVRGKKVKDLEEEAAREKREKEMKEKYDRWGKGLQQVEDQNKKIEEQLHEMNKPLARYADDEDLEKFLKEQEREGDPMLNYIRKKKKKEKVAAGISGKKERKQFLYINIIFNLLRKLGTSEMYSKNFFFFFRKAHVHG